MTEGGHGLVSFSPVDVGILRYGLELGWLGVIGVVGLWLGVLSAGVHKLLRLPDRETRSLGHHLIGIWGAVGVAQMITSFLHTGLIALMVAVFGGVLLNLDRISNSQADIFTLSTHRMER